MAKKGSKAKAVAQKESDTQPTILNNAGKSQKSDVQGKASEAKEGPPHPTSASKKKAKNKAKTKAGNAGSKDQESGSKKDSSNGAKPSKKAKTKSHTALHSTPIKSAPSSGHHMITRSAKRASEAGATFRTWQNTIPKDAKVSLQLGKDGMTAFLQHALELIHFDENIATDVIRALASVGGLERLREFLHQDFHRMTDRVLDSRWTTQIFPFLQILSHKAVHGRTTTKESHKRILQLFRGRNASQTVDLFRRIVRYLTTHDTGRLEAVKASTLILTELFEGPDSSQTCAMMRPTASALLSLVDENRAHDPLFTRLARLMQHEPISSEERITAPTFPRATTTTHISPHKLQAAEGVSNQSAPAGPRHDNDSADIRRIQILPTIQEIHSSRAEYLPSEDPSQWHLSGLSGLLDRHFRLYRYDTFCQIKRTIKLELGRLCNFDPKDTTELLGTRMNSYDNVQLHHPEINDRNGLLLVLSFDQPKQLRNVLPMGRQKWWEDAKRLAPGSFVSLVSSAGDVIFLQVHSPPPPPPRPPKQPRRLLHDEFTLAGHYERAFVIVELVERDAVVATRVFKACTGYRRNAERVLLEFPGVILPAFQPTLAALQDMTASLDFPFQTELVPGKAASSSKPPAYSLGSGFRFDLTDLFGCRDHLTARDIKLVTASSVRDIGAAISKSDLLDETQRKAVHHALTHSFALIQGPPGTGKSFTAEKLIQVLLRNRQSAKCGPIIIVSYTNHALDQFLENLLKAGIKDVMRVGSRSKSEQLAGHNLREIASKIKLKGESKEKSKKLRQSVKEAAHSAQNSLSRLDDLLGHHEDAITSYLEKHNPDAYSYLFANSQNVDEDGFMIVNRRKNPRPLKAWLDGDGDGSEKRRGMPDRPLDVLRGCHIGEMSVTERRALYASWMDGITEEVYRKLEGELSSYNGGKDNLDPMRDEGDLRALSAAHVVGITTTGLAQKRSLFMRLKPKVMLVEEVGEVLEPHLVTAMLPSLEHVILIGDHQQLRPRVQNYELSVDNPRSTVKFDISLLERKVCPGPLGDSGTLPYITLQTQRRMHPLISELIRTEYPNLEDDASVHKHPEVVGMRQRCFWWNHENKEDRTFDEVHTTSRTNESEVEMVAALVLHLVRQGVYTAGDIAVLTPYLGQLRKLKLKLDSLSTIVLSNLDEDELAEVSVSGCGSDDETEVVKSPSATSRSNPEALRLATVDNFQGEQAKVIIISLVRCNDDRNCGFLRTPNRINVLLSRAQHGMYIIGNAATSAHKVSMWREVQEILRAKGDLGDQLQLCCPRHPETALEVVGPSDFDNVSPEGGCQRPCEKKLEGCDHTCVAKCHSDQLHKAVVCEQPCDRPRPTCTHKCKLLCKDKCERLCNEVVACEMELDCGHRVSELPCWQYQNPSEYHCREQVEKIVPRCGHVVSEECHLSVEETAYQCREQCASPLECGHGICAQKCSQCRFKGEDGEIVQIEHERCNKICGRELTSCEHSCRMLCHAGDCPPCSKMCSLRCGHSRCTRNCSEPCKPCGESDCASACPHSKCTMPCAAPCNWVPCSYRCKKTLGCGHQCPSLCGESCPPAILCQICGHEDIRDARADLNTLTKYGELDLDETPCVFLPCGHVFTFGSLDGYMESGLYYDLGTDNKPIAINGPSLPFCSDGLKSCPDCRASISSVARYRRISKRALLDSNMTKLITLSNRSHRSLAEELQKQQSTLRGTTDKASLRGEINIRDRNLANELQNHNTGGRYRAASRLHDRIQEHLKRTAKEEQRYQKVRDLVEEATRRHQQPGVSTTSTTTQDFEIFEGSVLQVRGQLLASALLLRCDLVMATDLVTVYEKLPLVRRALITLLIDFGKYRQDCIALIQTAEKSKHVLQQAEAHIFWAQFAALERASKTTANEALKRDAMAHLDLARQLVEKYPGITTTIEDELVAVRRMLMDSKVGDSEVPMVVAAMEEESSGLGHWYRCANGHAFTVGECRGPMQTSMCPQCSGPIGGQHVQAAEGVTAADDIEQQFGNLRV